MAKAYFHGSKRGDIVTTPNGKMVCVRSTLTVPPSADWMPVSISDPSILPSDGADGERGPTGPKGRDGEPGRDSAVPGPAGRDGKSFRPRGLWNRNSDYLPLDVVSDGGGSSYLCVEANTGRRLANPRFWQVLAARGERGKDGTNAEHRYHVQRIGTGRISALEEQIAALLEAGGGSVTMRAIFDSDTAAGDVLYISGDNHVDKALANDATTATAVGIATEDVLAGAMGSYIPVGPVDCETWSLTPGTIYYLSPSVSGGLTDVYPDNPGEFVIVLGAAATPTQLNLSIHYLLEQ